MKSGTSVAGSQTKHTDGMLAKKPTAEQIRYAQILNTEDPKVLTEKIKQVADVTGYSQDEVSIALHDCNFDTEAAINTLIEGRQDQSEWVMRTNRKKKHQSSVAEGIDSIISSSYPSSKNTTVSSKPAGSRPPRAKGRNRQFGDQNSTAETDQKNDALVYSSNQVVTEGGRGRGAREDKWNDRRPGGRGGPPRRSGRGGGRPWRPFQTRTRDRPNRFGGGNRNDRNTASVNGPTVNGTEFWDGDDDVTKDKKTEEVADAMPPVTEEWGTDEWNTVSESAEPDTSELLFHSAVSPPHDHSWSDTPVASWETDTPSVSGSSSSTSSSVAAAAVVPTVDSQHNAQDTAAHFAPESVDMAVIHSKLAQNQSMSKDQFPKVGFQIPYIPLPGDLHGTTNHKDSLSKLLDKVGLTSVGLSDHNSITVQSQPQRQTRPPRAKKSQKSQIPVQAVEMPGSMNDSLDLQFGNLEFGGDSVSSPRKNEEEQQSLTSVEDSRSQEQISSHDTPSSPGESPNQQVINLPTQLPISTPVTIATTTSASSTVTTLEESSSRHFQHSSPQNQKQPLISQVSKPIQHEPIALTSKLDSRESPVPTKPAAAVTEQQKGSNSLQHSASIPSPSPLNGSNQPASLRPAISTTIPKDISLEARAYHHHHAGQPSVLTTKDKLVPAGSLSGTSVSTGMQRSELSSSDGPLQPPPGVTVPHAVHHQATSPNSTAFTTVTMSNTAKPLSHTTKPSLPPGVLPVNTLYGMQQGLIHAYPLPYSYEDLQRLPMSPYYDLPAFQAATRDGLSTAFHADQKYGRADASSPVPTSLNQGATLPQAHLQQQAFINATTMPHPYGYSGLAFYPGAGMVAAGGFPAYTTPMYQMPTKSHGNASQFQSAYNSGQHASHNFASGYDDLGPTHDFGPKSAYHTSVSASQSKSNAGGGVSTASDLSGAPFKPPGGKFNDSKAFLGGTPPPPMNLPITGQHGPLGSYAHTGHPYLSMVPPVQQHHPPSHFHQHHPLAHHMEPGQPVTSQRGAQGQGPKQGQNKGHQTVGYQGSPFWSGTN